MILAIFERALAYALDNAQVFAKAPMAGFVVLLVGCALGFKAAAWKYATLVSHAEGATKHASAEVQAVKSRLEYWAEQNAALEDSAKQFRALQASLIDSDGGKLRARALSFVEEVREFIARHRQEESEEQRSGMRLSSTASNEEASSHAWSELMDAMSRRRDRKATEWERRFKVGAKMLRDEMQSRSSADAAVREVDWAYIHPIGDISYLMVADDLEQLARAMPVA